MEQLFTAVMNNCWDKEEANQQDRKCVDENKTNGTSEETVEKKDNKKRLLSDLWGVIRRSQVFSVWPVFSCYLWKSWWRQWGFRTESHSQPLCKEKSNQNWARRCKIRSGTTRSKKDLSLQLKTSSSWYWDKRCGQGAWPWSRTSSPQKCPSSRRWCQLFWALSVGHEGRPTWAAVCLHWIHSCWQQLHRGTRCALQFTISSVSLNYNVRK
jgi:hypothetical protein